MGEWMDSFFDNKDSEPTYTGEGKAKPKKCWGFADRRGKCENIIVSIGGVFCNECRQYACSGDWYKWEREIDET